VRRIAIVLSLVVVAACKRESGNVARGRELITTYGCNSCHSIPGIRGAKGMVGPPLDKMGARQTIAGKFPNNASTMSQWLQNPQAMDPKNTMPDLGVTPADARDLAAFLDSLK
jgi:cytochrome c2